MEYNYMTSDYKDWSNRLYFLSYEIGNTGVKKYSSAYIQELQTIIKEMQKAYPDLDKTHTEIEIYKSQGNDFKITKDIKHDYHVLVPLAESANRYCVAYLSDYFSDGFYKIPDDAVESVKKSIINFGLEFQ